MSTPLPNPTRILIIQTDNRPDVEYLGLTKRVNPDSAKYLNELEEVKNQNYHYDYLLYIMEDKHYKPHNIHPATGKIYVMEQMLNERKEDIFVFLDSDAWIQNREHLHQIIVKLVNSESKQGCFSRDPYLKRNDYINSGSFIVKNNDYTRNIYKEIIQELKKDTICHNEWSYDQYYISQKIFKNRNDFFIFIPHIINTPEGQVLRHHWWKTQSMYSDLYEILDVNNPYKPSEKSFDFEGNLDHREYPNPNVYDYEYKR